MILPGSVSTPAKSSLYRIDREVRYPNFFYFRFLFLLEMSQKFGSFAASFQNRRLSASDLTTMATTSKHPRPESLANLTTAAKRTCLPSLKPDLGIGTIYECHTCATSFAQPQSLSRHYKSKSHITQLGKVSTPPESCEECGKTFVRRHDKVRHQKLLHGDGKQPCPVCSKLIRPGQHALAERMDTKACKAYKTSQQGLSKHDQPRIWTDPDLVGSDLAARAHNSEAGDVDVFGVVGVGVYTRKICNGAATLDSSTHKDLTIHTDT